jgi:D-ribitol-5-phosphate cytidylyltransferase
MNYAIILSGGIGTRMRTDGFPKQYLQVEGKTILQYTLETLAECSIIDVIVIVMAEEWKKKIGKNIVESVGKKILFALPGSSRQESIFHGLQACVANKEIDVNDKVIIQDAVRPLASKQLILRCLNEIEKYDGCMPAIPVVDTIYVSNDGKNIDGLLNRDTLFAGQAPEAFNLKKYYDINKNYTSEDFINIKGTTEIAYKHNLKVCIINGEEKNFKITTPTDLLKFETMKRKSKYNIEERI